MSTETTCTCPSGDGSLRWSCPAHQPSLRTSASAATAVQPVLASDLVFGYPRELFRVTPAGDVVVSEGVSTTDAARAFWEAVAQTRPRPHAAVLSQPSGNFGQLQQPSAAALAAAQPAQGGTVTGWRMIDGMTVFDVASHSGIVEPQQFVRYADYLAARQPVALESDAYELGAKGAPASEAERLLFEAWMRGHCWALSATWDGKTYRSDAEQGGMLCPHAIATRRIWAAWRDRAALVARQPMGEPVANRVIYPDGSRPSKWDSGKGYWPQVEGIAGTKFEYAFLPAPAAVPVDGLRESSILAKDHDGMRVCYSGLLRQARGALTRGSADPALAEMLRQLEKHMAELGKRWYAGDRLVVDELLQLYCIETNARRALLATHPQPAAAKDGPR
ncbi:hypothetical protein KV692_05290 [Xanthomonas euvesicatoria pv. physalidis]|uniref:hypothetical protein n=1 Tax=Xanthomonas euvesicatoria TaxID=456327 RepID=UPI001C4926BF|nr:hypothetical protein [Xanthomonas euvesicatoria]MBV6687306.1 hypothetical protein [Xanthomonas euvesicatoria pv. physalidis]MBV6794266.1 hypothetical protein [Xanthomonas campestris pv. daturae]